MHALDSELIPSEYGLKLLQAVFKFGTVNLGLVCKDIMEMGEGDNLLFTYISGIADSNSNRNM